MRFNDVAARSQICFILECDATEHQKINTFQIAGSVIE